MRCVIYLNIYEDVQEMSKNCGGNERSTGKYEGNKEKEALKVITIGTKSFSFNLKRVFMLLRPALYSWREQTKENGMRGARSVYGTHEKYIQNFNQES
jgi:hypothetical protein